jgi:hypothetical protein
MFFNRYITLSLPHYGLLLAGLLLRAVFLLRPAR